MTRGGLISVEEALARVLASAREPLGQETVALGEALGRTLARDLRALRTQPPFANSAMDGYALRAADAATAPTRLRVIGESAAGHAFSGVVGAGEAVRIFTGAPIPEGADAVALQEDAQREGDRSHACEPAVRPAKTCGRAGFDFARGRNAACGGTAPHSPRRRARRRGQPRRRSSCAGVRASPFSPPATNWSRRGRAHRPRADRRLQQFRHRRLVVAGGGEPIDLGIALDEPERAGAQPRARAGGEGRRAGDARRRLGRRLRSGAEGARRRRHGARLLAHRDAARQTADAWPSRRDARARPARQSDLVDGLRRCCSCGRCCARWSATLQAGADPSEPARLAVPLPANGVRQDYMRATLARDGDGVLARQRPCPSRIPRSSKRSRAPTRSIVRPPYAPPPRRARPAASSASRRSGRSAARREEPEAPDRSTGCASHRRNPATIRLIPARNPRATA